MINIEQYKTDGIAECQLPDSVMQLKQQLAEQLCLWLNYWGGYSCNPQNLSAEIYRIAQINRPLLGKLYKVARRLPAIKQMACDSGLIAIASQLMQTPLISCCNFVCLRFDIPGEDKYLLGLHQDFPYIQGSENGLTLWMALGEVTLNMGPPAFIAGSHQQGVLPVTEQKLSQTYGQNGGSTIAIADPQAQKSPKLLKLPLCNQNGLFFSTLLLHQSQPNLSQQARISVQLRFDDLCHVKSFERNYPEGLYLNNAFGSSYPEYVVSVD